MRDMQPSHDTLNGEFTITPQQSPSDARDKLPPSNIKESSTTSPSIFAHFVQNPTNLSFQNKDPHEKVLLILRSHMIVNIPWIFFSLVLFFAPLLLLLLTGATSFIKLDAITKTLMLAVYYLIVFGYAFLNFILWYFQVTIITSEKVIDIDLNSILSHQVNEAPLESVRDIEYSQKGILASFFDYGNIMMETETRTQDLEVVNAPHPAKVVDIIGNLSRIKEKEEANEHD